LLARLFVLLVVITALVISLSALSATLITDNESRKLKLKRNCLPVEIGDGNQAVGDESLKFSRSLYSAYDFRFRFL